MRRAQLNFSIDLGYLGGPLMPSSLAAIEQPVELSFKSLPSNAYIGSTAACMPAALDTNLPLKERPALYIGKIASNIGAIYLHVILPFDANREAVAAKLYGNFYSLHESLKLSSLGAISAGGTRKITVVLQEVSAFADWMERVLAGDKNHCLLF
ncbi:hypothetical protein ENBRE01_1635 [Enteropsectra breve]|nr:hypothetical protein ENBRE01_1635 [Enteropsectra breve]